MPKKIRGAQEQKVAAAKQRRNPHWMEKTRRVGEVWVATDAPGTGQEVKRTRSQEKQPWESGEPVGYVSSVFIARY